jgi:hypothetical protein
MHVMKDLRGIVVKIVIGSFSLAALLGIIALLGGGDFGETEAKILLTTVIVGVESVAVLCYLSLAERPTAWIGALGGLVSLVPFVLALLLTWEAIDDRDAFWQTFGVGITIAASIAQVCLLLALVERKRIGGALAATLVSIAVVAVMISIAIVNGEDLGDFYWRSFGVVAILDVLGTVVLSALAAFGRGRPQGEPDLLTAAVESRIVDAAAKRGMSPSQLVSEALDSFLR